MIPILLVVVFAVVDFGSAYNYRNDVTHLANQAARFAAVGNCGTGCMSVELATKNSADSDTLKDGNGSHSTGTDQPLQVCIDFPSGSGQRGEPVRATVETNYRFLPLLGFRVRLYAQATLRIDQAYSASGASASPYTPVTLGAAAGGNCPGYASS